MKANQLRASRRAWASTAAVLAASLFLFFQNCGSSFVGVAVNGNGNGYDGMVGPLPGGNVIGSQFYAHLASAPCADGDPYDAAIEYAAPASWVLVREACAELATPLAVDPSAFVWQNDVSFVYGGRRFDPADKP